MITSYCYWIQGRCRPRRPQRKGRVPQYSRVKLVELQGMFDELEQCQVFLCLGDVVVSVETTPSFLTKSLPVDFNLLRRL